MSTAICALCGRPTVPAVMIGPMAVGPKCASRAGLTPNKAKKGSRVVFLRKPKASPAARQGTRDLFDEREVT